MPPLFVNRSISPWNPCMRGGNYIMPDRLPGGPSLFGFGFMDCGCHHHCGYDDGFGKALLWGSVAGVGLGVICAFAKPIGKGIATAASWTWNKVLKPAGKAIGAAASWTWNKVFKPAGKAIGTAASRVWNGIKSIFKKENISST